MKTEACDRAAASWGPRRPFQSQTQLQSSLRLTF